MMAKSKIQNPKSETAHPPRVFDAQGRILGRLSTEIALALRGKDTPAWRPYIDSGRAVVVTNTDQVQVTGEKLTKKLYYRHTQHKPGAERILMLRQRMERDSRGVVRDAVWNMLPKNKLRHRMIARLKLFRGQAPEQQNAE